MRISWKEMVLRIWSYQHSDRRASFPGGRVGRVAWKAVRERKIRNPKFEIRNKFEIQMGNVQNTKEKFEIRNPKFETNPKSKWEMFKTQKTQRKNSKWGVCLSSLLSFFSFL
jgi:hypothetical protein